MNTRLAAAAAFALVLASLGVAAESTGPLDAQQLYAARCSACHDHPMGIIPPKSFLGFKSPDAVVRALSGGAMRTMAAGLSKQEMESLAVLLTGRQPGEGEIPASANRCAEPAAPVQVTGADWPLTGRTLDNSRYQPDPGLDAKEVSRLRLKWAFAYPGGAAGPAVVAGGMVFLGTGAYRVYALDARTGCTHWTYEAGRLVRGVTVGQPAGLPGPPGATMVFFGDDRGNVYALDAQTGELVWKVGADSHVVARLTVPPVLFGETLYVPLSSMEDPLTYDPGYPCCTFRGSVVALNARTGEFRWKTYMIAQEPRLLPQTSATGTPQYGPAGAAIWVPLTIDPERRRIYASTSESYREQGVVGTNSVVALDLDTGRRVWTQELRPRDFNRSCATAVVPNCTERTQLLEVSCPPMLVTSADHRQVIVVGQKSGVLFALDPDRNGAMVWERRISKGADLGGLMYGQATDGETVYVPISDTDEFGKVDEGSGGVTALQLKGGKVRWHTPAPHGQCAWDTACTAAQATAPTLIPGVLFAGSWDGHVRAYRTEDGAIIWDGDTGRPVEAVNGAKAVGGGVSGWPLQVVNGSLFVTSGASTLNRPGNALLVYSVDGK